MNQFIFIDQNIDKLRREIKKSKKDVFSRLETHSETYFLKELPENHPSCSTTYMGLAIANLSLMYILGRKPRYLKEAKRWIFTCLGYPHWGNAHLVDVDLSAAWILFGMGLGYDWLKDQFSPDEEKKIREKILLQGTRMYDFKVKTEGSGWSTNYWQNHNWINMTGLATAAYALCSKEPQVQKWIDASKANFETVYSVLPEDGSDYEGVVYWRYGAMWLFIYAHLLKEREGIDYFKSCDFLKNTFYYRLYQAAPNLEEQINFGDCHDRRSGHSTAIYYKVASEYKNGHAQKLGNLVRTEFLEREASLSKVKPGIMPECLFEMLFYNPQVKEESFHTLPLTRYFEDLGLFVSRSSWNKDASHFSFKCSVPGGKKQWSKLWELKAKGYDCFGLSHQHPDNNSFLLVDNNHYYAIDDGYNRNVKAGDHNTIIIDGKGYQDEGQNNIWSNYSPEMIGKILACKEYESFSYVLGETASVYDKSLALNSFKRHIIASQKGYFVILDELESDLPHQYTWQMYSDAFPEVAQDHFIYQGNNSQLKVYSMSGTETSYAFKENIVRAVMTTQEPDKFTENKMKGLTISNKKNQNKYFFLSLLVLSNSSFKKVHVKKIKEKGSFQFLMDFEGEKEQVFYSPSWSKDSETQKNNGKLDLCITTKRGTKKTFRLKG